MMTSLKNSAVAGVKWNTVTIGIRIGTQFVSLAILARLLDPEDFGLMSMALLVIGFAKIFTDFGLSNAIMHFQDATKEQLSSLYWINVLFSWLIFVLIIVSTPLVANFYSEPALIPILKWSALSFIITPFGTQFKILLQREFRFKEDSLVAISESLVYGISAIGFALGGYGVMSLVWANLLQVTVSTFAYFLIGLQSGWLPLLHCRWHEVTAHTQFGLYQMAERSLNYFGSNIDYLIIGRYLGSESLGYYSLAYNIIRQPATHLNSIVVSVATPIFSHVQRQNDTLRRGYLKVVRFVSAMTFPVYAGIFAIAPILILVVYGEQWLPVVPVLQILCLLGAIRSLGSPTGSLFVSKGRADLGFYLNIYTLAGYAISNLIGVRWGIIGVAASSLVFLILSLPVGIYLRWYLIGLSPRDYWHSFRIPTFASLGMMFLVILLRNNIGMINNPIFELVVLVLVGVLSYGAIIWLANKELIEEVWSYISTRAVVS